MRGGRAHAWAMATAAGIAVVATAAPASAATIQVVPRTAFARDVGTAATVDVERFHELQFNGPARVDLVVGQTRRSYLVRVRSGHPSVGRGCHRTGARAVVCSRRDVMRIHATLSRGADRLDLHGVTRTAFGVLVRGGEGNDTLTATRGGARLEGGRGNDRVIGSSAADDLSGGPGRDIVSGGSGNDVLRDGDAPPAGDRYDGGPGRDELSYAGRRAPVTVDLGARSAGAAGEGDRLASIEDAEGGRGADTLIGDAGPNTLAGGLGADTLRGGAGNDRLRTQGAVSPTEVSLVGADPIFDEAFAIDQPADAVVDGGDGDDELSLAAKPGAPGPPPVCGAGSDRVVRADQGTLLPSDCETVQLPGLFPGATAVTESDENVSYSAHAAGAFSAYPIRVAGGTAVFRLVCPAARTDPFFRATLACRGSLAVDGGAARAFSVARGATAEVAAALTPADVAALPGGVQARVTITPPADAPTGDDNTPPPIGWSIALHA